MEGPRKDQFMETTTLAPIGQEWPILQECTAPVHNTLRARRAKGAAKCWCPGAIMAYREYRRTVSNDDTVQAAYRKGLQPKPASLGAVKRPMPDFRGGTCTTTPQGRVISDKAFTTDTSSTGFTARDKAKAQCGKCPILMECLGWITGEQEKGAYGGVYGGMDIWDRQGRPQRLGANGQVEAAPRVTV